MVRRKESEPRAQRRDVDSRSVDGLYDDGTKTSLRLGVGYFRWAGAGS